MRTSIVKLVGLSMTCLPVAAISPTASAGTITGSAVLSTPTVAPSQSDYDLFSLIEAGDGVVLSGGSGFFASPVAWTQGTGSLTPMGQDANSAITSYGGNGQPTSVSLKFGTLSNFSLTSALGTFTGTSSITINGQQYHSEILNTTGSPQSGSESVTVYEVGNFVAANPASGANILSYVSNTYNGGTPVSSFDQTMSMTFTFNETGIQTAGNYVTRIGSISGSATISTPGLVPPTTNGDPPIPVPEPASLALLATGVLGLGWARRRRA